MTVFRITTIQKYVGLSTDTMPLAPIGSELFATDNKSTYVCYDGIHWSSRGVGAAVLSTPSASMSPSVSPSLSPSASRSPSVSPSASPS